MITPRQSYHEMQLNQRKSNLERLVIGEIAVQRPNKLVVKEYIILKGIKRDI